MATEPSETPLENLANRIIGITVDAQITPHGNASEATHHHPKDLQQHCQTAGVGLPLAIAKAALKIAHQALNLGAPRNPRIRQYLGHHSIVGPDYLVVSLGSAVASILESAKDLELITAEDSRAAKPHLHRLEQLVRTASFHVTADHPAEPH